MWKISRSKTNPESRLRGKRAGAFALGIGGELGASRSYDKDDPAQLPAVAMSKARSWLAKRDNFPLLRNLRAERRAARQQALEEAQRLAQLAHSKGEEYDPAAAITRPIARNQRICEARRSGFHAAAAA
jgi:hypothetical protein